MPPTYKMPPYKIFFLIVSNSNPCVLCLNGFRRPQCLQAIFFSLFKGDSPFLVNEISRSILCLFFQFEINYIWIQFLNKYVTSFHSHVQCTRSLINIQCTTSHTIQRQLISMCLLNIRSFKNKSAAFYDYICDCKANLIAVTETWLTVNDNAVRAEIQPPGYKLVDFPRSSRGGGGTALIYRDAFNGSKIDAGEKVSFEFSEWKVVIPSSHDLRIIIVYRTPYSDNRKVPSSTFFNEFSEYLESVVLCSEQLIIVGDFNFHIDVQNDNDAVTLLDTLESFGLEQHVAGPTHTEDHTQCTLDLIITRTSDKLINDSPRIDCYLSDHASVLCSLNSNRPPLKTQKVTYRRLKAINIINLNKDLADSSLCYASPDDVDHLAECYDATLASVIDKHAPFKSKVIVEHPRVPWFNDEIKEAKRKRRKAEQK